MHSINLGFVLLAVALASQAAPLEDKCLALPQHLRPLYCDTQITDIKRDMADGIEARGLFGKKKGSKGGSSRGGTNGGSTHIGGNSGGSEGGAGGGGSQGGTNNGGVQGGSGPKTTPHPTLQPTKAADPKTDPPTKPTEAAKPADRSRYKPNFDAAGKVLSYTLEGTNTVISVVQFAQMFGGGQESSSTPSVSSIAPTPSATTEAAAADLPADEPDPQDPTPPARRGIDADSVILERGLFGGPWDWVWDGTKFIAHVIDNKFGEDKGKVSGGGGEDNSTVAQPGV